MSEDSGTLEGETSNDFQLIEFINSILLLGDEGTGSDWARETVDLVSRVLTFGISPLTNDVTSNSMNILLSSGWWGLTFLTVPLVLTGLIWYFILTFFLDRNIMDIMTGRNFRSIAVLNEPEELNKRMNDLMSRVSAAVDLPR